MTFKPISNFLTRRDVNYDIFIANIQKEALRGLELDHFLNSLIPPYAGSGLLIVFGNWNAEELQGKPEMTS